MIAGLLASGMALTLAGMAGIATRDAVATFDNLPVPDVAQLPARSEILDSHGRLIAYYYPNHIYRVPVTYGQIAPSMREAIVAIEDSRFYQHGAIDIRGTMRAMVTDLSAGQVQGGSTLAQQYVKNALLLTADDRAEQRAADADDLARKIRELRIAAKVEHELTPDQLLAAYLNVAYFANEAYGIEVAAERYFGRTAATLTLPQSAMLAGMVQNPEEFNPVTNPAAATRRRNVVLGRMAQLGYISKATAASAGRAPAGVHFRPQSLAQGCSSAAPTSATWFCDYVLAELRTNRAYGTAWHDLNTIGGLKIHTTLNPQDQTAAQHAVNFMLPAPPSAFNPGRNAAAEVLIQPGTGAVEAIAVDRPYGVGNGQDSVDYAVDTPQDGGLGVQSGSSSKLFTLITALERGTPFGFSLSVSSPSVVRPYYNCNRKPAGSFRVANSEGAGHGTYSLYTGTTQSINVFYAKLEQRVG
ncbi:MAG TPA: transglycosylase domain-containing protein, partial [Streptosporangiaceae bacterium]|nr:transglycosylase domain-containing protein [Streptosporangiaceae bacterium]